MNPEIRRAALRAAATTAVVVGCTGGHSPPAPATSGQKLSDQECVRYLDSLARANQDELPDGDPLKGKPDVYEAFADVAARTAAPTVDCCTRELAAGTRAHGFACCSVVDPWPEGGGVACTPWGPPVPPEMQA